MERNLDILVLSSILDNRYGKDKIVSRSGVEIPCISIDDKSDVLSIFKNENKKINCVLVDESQFLKSYQVDQLTIIVDKFNVPVICYGLRSDYKLNSFEGSLRLLLLADQIEELKTLCQNCKKKAILNIRYSILEGTRGFCKTILTEGDQVQVGGNECYMPLCRKCYNRLVDLTAKIKVKDTSIIPEGPYCYTGKSYSKGVYHIEPCPYFDHIEKGGSQSDGYCHYIEGGDSNLDGSDNLNGCGLLWDQVKSCSINDDIDEKDII